MIPEIIITVVIASFILEFMDASIGMGYGQITPLLLLMGFAPLEVIPAALLTSSVMSLIAGFLHNEFKNVDFSVKSKDFKITSVLTLFGTVGVLIGVFLAIRVSENFLRLYIGGLVIIIGVLILLKHKRKIHFSWKKIIGLGSVAAFNKGMTGGGYGPVLAGGQIVSGVNSKKAVGITAMTEGLICLIGFIAYLFIEGSSALHWPLIISLLIGGVASTPLAVIVVKKFKTRKLRYTVGVVSILMGLAVLIKLLLEFI